MPSQVWGRDPQEAFEEPYEYGIQDQFAREARTLFARLYKLLNSDCHRYSVDDRSREKAVWLLSMDALDSLRECLEALSRKEHRVASKLFRDVMESMDLAEYFHNATDKSKVSLGKWYADEIVPHREYRDYIKRVQSAEAAADLTKHYSSLSRFTHRSYRAILNGYSVGREERLVHDRTGELYGSHEGAVSLLVLPQTIASYYAVLGNLALEYATELSELGLVTREEIQEAFAMSLDSETVSRRFLPRRWLAERLQGSAAESKDEK
jgi:hypothetical protein